MVAPSNSLMYTNNPDFISVHHIQVLTLYPVIIYVYNLKKKLKNLRQSMFPRLFSNSYAQGILYVSLPTSWDDRNASHLKIFKNKLK